MFIDKIKLTDEIVDVVGDIYNSLGHLSENTLSEEIRKILDKYLPSEEIDNDRA